MIGNRREIETMTQTEAKKTEQQGKHRKLTGSKHDDSKESKTEARTELCSKNQERETQNKENKEKHKETPKKPGNQNNKKRGKKKEINS